MKGEVFLFLLIVSLAKCEINATVVLKYQKYEIPDINFVCSKLTISNDVSRKCAEQLQIVCGNITLLETMLDASSKFPYSGLGYASRMDFGNFDQCMTINHNYDGGKILGKYCTGGLLIPDVFGNISDINAYFKLALCKPDACSADDYTEVTSSLIPGFPHLFQDSMCQTIETGSEFTASDIVTITLFAIVILLMTVSTIYDIYLYKTQSKSHHPLYVAFSVFSNGKKLLHVSKNSKQQIQAFHGLRVISMMWIVAGHGFSGFGNMSVNNLDATVQWLHKLYAAYITAAPLAVDTFFFMSGFLLAFQYFKQIAKPLREQITSIPHMYLHRYLRLTPAALMIYLVTISIFKHLGSGPLYHYGAESFDKPCRDHWWSFFLYIQNYYNYDDFCLIPTWYLSADMQMFIFSPLLLIPISLLLKKSSGYMWSMIDLFILNIFFTFLPMVLKLTIRDYSNDYDTHSRIINYSIGIMLAIFMRIKQDKPFLYTVKNQHLDVANLSIWIVILLGMLTTVICYQEVEMNHGYESRSVFYSLMRPAWCIGLSWIIYSCYHGYGGIVNWILTAPIMHVIGKLTYCIYLTHISVVIYFLVTNRDRFYFSDYNVFYVWCGHFTVSMIVATFWTLAFESPLLIIEKYVLGTRNRKNLETHEPRNGHKTTEGKRENVY